MQAMNESRLALVGLLGGALLPTLSGGASFSCGGTVAESPHSSSSNSGDATVELPRSIRGWSIRDRTPYPRVGHSAVFDEEGDRMIVFEGGANDTWELPLSGLNANVWRELIAAGDHPPPHGYRVGVADSA